MRYITNLGSFYELMGEMGSGLLGEWTENILAEDKYQYSISNLPDGNQLIQITGTNISFVLSPKAFFTRNTGTPVTILADWFGNINMVVTPILPNGNNSPPIKFEFYNIERIWNDVPNGVKSGLKTTYNEYQYAVLTEQSFIPFDKFNSQLGIRADNYYFIPEAAFSGAFTPQEQFNLGVNKLTRLYFIYSPKLAPFVTGIYNFWIGYIDNVEVTSKNINGVNYAFYSGVKPNKKGDNGKYTFNISMLNTGMGGEVKFPILPRSWWEKYAPKEIEDKRKVIINPVDELAAKLQEQISNQAKEIADKNTEIGKLNEKINQLNNTLSTRPDLSAELLQKTAEIKALQDKLTELNTTLPKSQAEIVQKNNEIVALNRRLDELQNSIKNQPIPPQVSEAVFISPVETTPTDELRPANLNPEKTSNLLNYLMKMPEFNNPYYFSEASAAAKRFAEFMAYDNENIEWDRAILRFWEAAMSQILDASTIPDSIDYYCNNTGTITKIPPVLLDYLITNSKTAPYIKALGYSEPSPGQNYLEFGLSFFYELVNLCNNVFSPADKAEINQLLDSTRNKITIPGEIKPYAQTLFQTVPLNESAFLPAPTSPFITNAEDLRYQIPPEPPTQDLADTSFNEETYWPVFDEYNDGEEMELKETILPSFQKSLSKPGFFDGPAATVGVSLIAASAMGWLARASGKK